jgi:DinB superfamily
MRKPSTRSTKRRATAPADGALRAQVVDLLRRGNAHIPFEDAVADWPPELRGVKPAGQPFTAWRLLEHIRVAQWDIVEFTKSARHQSPPWPEGYWPAADAPPDAQAWERSLAQITSDRRELERIVTNPATDLHAPIRHGSGQTVLREALVLADHNAYHLGQLVLLRRLLGAWPR